MATWVERRHTAQIDQITGERQPPRFACPSTCPAWECR